ncbi:MAG: hypothetical protein WBQ89_22430 [Candidatus Acidiferrum sp.]
MRPFLDRPLLRHFSLFLSLFIAFSVEPGHSAPADSTSLDEAIHQLAERVAAIPNIRGPLRPQFFQDANFAAGPGKDWQGTFRKEIENHHLALTDDPAAPVLRIGLGETPTQLVLSASIRVSDQDEVCFFILPRSAFRAANLPVAPIRIERQLVYQSPDRILDASSLWNGTEGGMALLAYRNADLFILRLDSSGQIAQAISLTAAGAQLSRDPRGELTVRASDGTALLPTKGCDFTWIASADAKCHSAKPAWRGPTVLSPSCNAGGWELLTGTSDWSTPDVLQVVPDGSLREGSAALLSDFPGPILSINGEQDPASAFVVTKNLRTGNYEVYNITLACGN